VYVPSPRKALAGVFEVAGVIGGTPEWLWHRVGKRAAVTKKQFDDYYTGTFSGYAISIAKASAFAHKLTLDELRKKLPGFHPPQSYLYLNETQVQRIGAVA